jgi:hypothetical protein
MVEFIIKYWLEVIFALIVGIISFIFKKIYSNYKNKMENLSVRQQAVEQGVQALLRNELIRSYREYETKGELSILDKENIEEMFVQYENLGGNGTVKQLMTELLQLPTKIMKS